MRCVFNSSALLSLLILVTSPRGNATEEAYPHPNIFFPETQINFGTGGRAEEITKTFNVENHGEGDLIVSEIEPSCGQVVTDAGARSIPSGGRSEIAVSVKLGNRVGPQRFPFVVKTNDPDEPEVTIVLQGEVRTGIVTNPESLSFGTVPAGSRSMRSIELRDLDRKALVPVRATTATGYLSAEIKRSEAVEKHRWNLSVSMNAGQAPLGPFVEAVTVELLEKGHAPKRLDIPVTGVVVSADAIAETGESPVAGTLSFVANRNGNWDVFSWLGRDAEPQQITNTAYDEKWPSLTGVSGSVAFTTTEGVPVVVDGSAGAQSTLVVSERPGKWDTCQLSPDGRSLVCAYFTPTEADRSELAIVDLGTLDARPVVEQFGPQFFPTWSPDGKQIAYAYAHCSSACGRIIQEIWVADTQSGEARQLVKTNAHCLRPSWSPEGDKLAFAADIDGNFDIWLYDLKSEKLIRLTDYAGLDESPAFGPDGSQLVFISNRGGRKGLWLKDLESGEERELKPFGYKLVEIKDVAWGWPKRADKEE